MVWAAPYNTQTLQSWAYLMLMRLSWWLTVLGCILLGTIVCHGVEKPSRGLMRKLLRGLSREPEISQPLRERGRGRR